MSTTNRIEMRIKNRSVVNARDRVTDSVEKVLRKAELKKHEEMDLQEAEDALYFDPEEDMVLIKRAITQTINEENE